MGRNVPVPHCSSVWLLPFWNNKKRENWCGNRRRIVQVPSSRFVCSKRNDIMSIAERRHRHNNDIMKDSWDEKMSTSKSDRVADQLPEYGSGYLQLPVILYFGYVKPSLCPFHNQSDDVSFAVLCASAAQSPRQSLQIYGFSMSALALSKNPSTSPSGHKG